MYKYDINFNLEEELELPSEMKEGWGLTNDESWLYATDGTENIYKIDPKEFKVVETIPVYIEDESGKQPVKMLNEIQMVEGYIYSNIYTSNDIVRIDPTTGAVDRKWNMQELWEDNREYVDLLLETG